MKTKIYIPSDDAFDALISTPNLTWEKIAEHYPPSVGIDDWRKLLDPKNWREEFSAHEVASSWEKSRPGLPPRISALFSDSAKLLAAIPEHKRRCHPIAIAAQVDLMCSLLFA